MSNNNISPKNRFLSNQKRADAHQDLVMAPDFKAACEITLAQYAISLQADRPDLAMANAYKMEGAVAALNILLNLGDPKKPERQSIIEQLTPP